MTHLKPIAIITSIAFILLLSACRSSRQALPTSAYGTTLTSTLPVTSPHDAVTQLCESYSDWSHVTMPVKLSVSAPSKLSLSGKASLIRGKEIKLSFRMLGFEVGALYANTDSLYFYEKMNRTIVGESMANLTASTGLTLSDLQDILLGQLAYPGGIPKAQPIKKTYNISASDSTITLSPRRNKHHWTYTLLPTAPLLSVEKITFPIPSAKGQIKCVYSTPLLTPAGPVSPQTKLFADYGKNSLALSLSWSLESAQWDNQSTPSLNLPKGYRRIPFSMFIKSLIAQPNHQQ